MGLYDRVIRAVLNVLTPYVEYIVFYVLYPGGMIYSIAQYFYIKLFNVFVRQRDAGSSYNGNYVAQGRRGANKNLIPDWENPQVVGRRRRAAHCDVRSFQNNNELFRYCRSVDTKPALSSVLYLTGEPGEPDGNCAWKFLLVGSPDNCPTGWNEERFNCEGQPEEWSQVALPNHWQLQGHDIPIYTNTTYPFQFDPPRARRNGLWTNTACDLGLGASDNPAPKAGQPLRQPLHPKEPGENATGLFRCQFSLEGFFHPKSASTKSDSSGVYFQRSPRGKAGEWANSEHADPAARLFLVFAGVDSCMTVWVNGQYVGYSQDSCLPAEFDVTDACRHSGGDKASHMHTLAVQVSRWCDGSYLEDQDKWWLSGIYREVYLEKRPAAFLSDFEFSSAVDIRSTIVRPDGGAEPRKSSGEGGDVSADVFISVSAEGVRTSSSGITTPFNSQRAHAARIELWKDVNADEEPVVCFTKEFSGGDRLPNRVAADSVFRDRKSAPRGEDVAHANSPGVLTVRAEILDPMLWTAETPFLYTLVISLHESLDDARANRRESHCQAHKVGIRKVSIGGPDHVLRINDAPITIAGINRHEFHPRTGRAVSKESMRQDAILLKKLNFSAVRGAHYPQHPYWLEVCDEVGLYVIDEANIETHGFQALGQPVGYLANLPEWETALATRVTRMYERDKNHACIIGWSLGNESGHGATHDLMARWLRLRDPARFVQYESGGARTDATDIICPMYMRPHWCLEQSLRDDKKRPVILCEYAHAMGNSGGCLAHYWHLFRDSRYPRVQGGFIWDFVDQGLLLPGGAGFGYGGDFGDHPNTKQFCCNGIANPERRLFPGAMEAAHLQSPVEITLLFDRHQNPVLVVSNRRSFADLSDMQLAVRPCYHSSTVNRFLVGVAFQVPCGPIAAGSFQRFDIVDQLQKSLEDSCFSGGTLDMSELCDSVGLSCTSEAWLDVSASVMEGKYSWSPESFEVMHASLVSAELKVTLKRLASHLSPFPSPLTREGVSWCSDTSASADSTPAASPHPRLSPITTTTTPRTNQLASTVTVPDNLHVQAVELFGGEPGQFIRWSNGAVARIGKECGRLLSWQDRDGHELLAEPVDGCLYRAGTDNDRGGMLLSYYARWKEVGLDRLVRREQKSAVFSQKRLPDGSIEIITKWTWASPRDAVIAIQIACRGKYTFLTNGSIEVDFSADAPANTPPVARCGLRWAMPAEFSAVKYFGLGPHEAYDDRRASAYLGVFENQVSEMHTPYTFPQDCGRRADPRWAIFRREVSSSGLLVMPVTDHNHGGHVGASLLNHNPLLVDAVSSDNSTAHASSFHAESSVRGWGFSALPYSLEALDRTAHNHELVPSPDCRIHVHFDSHTMGLGGYDSWSPNVDEQYLVHPQLEAPSMRQATMPASIAPRTPRGTPRALRTVVRMTPLVGI